MYRGAGTQVPITGWQVACAEKEEEEEKGNLKRDFDRRMQFKNHPGVSTPRSPLMRRQTPFWSN
jgi:hypothetical protein